MKYLKTFETRFSEFEKSSLKQEIFNYISGCLYGIQLHELLKDFPNYEQTMTILKELLSEKKIEYFDSNYKAVKH